MSINGIALTTGQIQRAHKIDLAFQSIIPLCQIVVYIYKIFYEFLLFYLLVRGKIIWFVALDMINAVWILL